MEPFHAIAISCHEKQCWLFDWLTFILVAFLQCWLSIIVVFFWRWLFFDKFKFISDSKDVFALLKGHERKVAPGEEPTFTWFKSGQEFDPEDRFKVLFKDEEDTLALVFQHINPEDAGLYTCVASTSAGKIACHAELSVEGGITQLLKVWCLAQYTILETSTSDKVSPLWVRPEVQWILLSPVIYHLNQNQCSVPHNIHGGSTKFTDRYDH